MARLMLCSQQRCPSISGSLLRLSPPGPGDRTTPSEPPGPGCRGRQRSTTCLNHDYGTFRASSNLLNIFSPRTLPYNLAHPMGPLASILWIGILAVWLPRTVAQGLGRPCTSFLDYPSDRFEYYCSSGFACLAQDISCYIASGQPCQLNMDCYPNNYPAQGSCLAGYCKAPGGSACHVPQNLPSRSELHPRAGGGDAT